MHLHMKSNPHIPESLVLGGSRDGGNESWDSSRNQYS